MTHTGIDAGALANVQYRQIGKPLTRTDAPGKVTGRTPYAGDYVMPNMLHMRVLRADIASARLVRLDVSKARALKGVARVLTATDLADRTAATDIPGQTGQKRLDTDQPVLVKERVRYFGEPLALIAAETRDLADRAADLIEFELEPNSWRLRPFGSAATRCAARLRHRQHRCRAQDQEGRCRGGLRQGRPHCREHLQDTVPGARLPGAGGRPRLGGWRTTWSTSASRPR